MSPFQFALIAMLIIGIIVLIITFLVKKKIEKTSSKPSEQNPYLTFFILGITFLPMGLVLSITVDNPGFYGITAMGLIFLVVGLSNKDKWDEGK
jgi:uncharacterized membrane protein